MLRAFLNPPRRDTSEYRRFRRAILRDRPICEHCNEAPSTIVAHQVQPLAGGPLIDNDNVLALCVQCDREFTRSHPPLRRRPQPRN